MPFRISYYASHSTVEVPPHRRCLRCNRRYSDHDAYTRACPDEMAMAAYVQLDDEPIAKVIRIDEDRDVQAVVVWASKQKPGVWCVGIKLNPRGWRGVREFTDRVVAEAYAAELREKQGLKPPKYGNHAFKQDPKKDPDDPKNARPTKPKPKLNWTKPLRVARPPMDLVDFDGEDKDEDPLKDLGL